MGDRTAGELAIENGFDDDHEVDATRQRAVRVERSDLAVHRDQPRRTGISHSVQFATAAITCIHKDTPASEFGARVQNAGGRRECLDGYHCLMPRACRQCVACGSHVQDSDAKAT